MKKLEISKENLINNINIIKSIANEQNNKIIAVVKANGMGLDLIKYSKILLENGIDMLAVANYEEAILLRKEKVKANILMLSPCIEKKELQLLIENDITLTISNLDEYKLIQDILTEEKELEVKAHIKIDTGFGRYGFLYNDVPSITEIFKDERIKILGTYTHFSKPQDKKWTTLQFNRFMSIVKNLIDKGYNLGMLHASSSTAFLKYPEMRLDAIRIGSVFQGRTLVNCKGLIKIGKFKTNIIEIKNLPKGYNISYGNTYRTKKETTVAIIPIGYMDGFNAGKLRDDFSIKNNLIAIGMEIKKLFKDNNLKVKINSNYYKVIGRIGMYHSIIDITNSNNINIGDEVEVNITPLQTNDIIRREYI